MMKKIITGHWDGEEIWRFQTAQEFLLEQLQHYKLKVDKVEIDKEVQKKLWPKER